MRLLRRLIFIVVVIGAAGAGYWWYAQGGLDPEVALTRPTRGTAVRAIYATGQVEPVTWARVGPLAAARIMAIHARDGEMVAQGQALAQLDDREARARLAEFEARERFWREESQRQLQLADRGFASREARERAQSEWAAVQAAIAGQRQRIADLVLTAPIAGQILRQDGEIGEIADARQTLFWVGQPRPLRITAEIDEEDIPLVVSGQAVLIKADAFPDRDLRGQIGEITPRGDPVNKTFRVRVNLPDDTPLRIGMTTEINVVVREDANALLIPATALRQGRVFIVENGVARARAVRVGIVGRVQAQVVDGLDENSRVIVNPAGIEDGARVRARGP